MTWAGSISPEMRGQSPHFPLVVMRQSFFHLMLFVPHVFRFLLYPVHVVSCGRFIWRREHGDDSLKLFPFAVAFRTGRGFRRGGNHKVFEDGPAFPAFVFEDWHGYLSLSLVNPHSLLQGTLRLTVRPRNCIVARQEENTKCAMKILKEMRKSTSTAKG